MSWSWDSNVATAVNAEAELIGAPIPRPLCAPMKSEPGPLSGCTAWLAIWIGWPMPLTALRKHRTRSLA